MKEEKQIRITFFFNIIKMSTKQGNKQEETHSSNSNVSKWCTFIESFPWNSTIYERNHSFRRDNWL